MSNRRHLSSRSRAERVRLDRERGRIFLSDDDDCEWELRDFRPNSRHGRTYVPLTAPESTAREFYPHKHGATPRIYRFKQDDSRSLQSELLLKQLARSEPIRIPQRKPIAVAAPEIPAHVLDELFDSLNAKE
jgi:hypothetical protein